ncbi:hypothetical protein HYALB_00009216 [Hymenoscyphus albidus]|uniref:CFEM domain-containing protein n=1 Tax=Hymenoscyphus albidus TaxID=595503 RepID=A0A9N9Q1N0_9HELO|nr:hypothetical protein HYALB_00009216 [Hymenoscyphus albidus]
MQFNSILFMAAATIVSAQNFAGIPTCAQECIRSSITSAGCALTDASCQCSPSAYVSIQNSASSCLIKSNACKPDELATAANNGAKLCDQFRASGGVASNATVTAVGTGGTIAPTSNGTALSTSARLTATSTSTTRPSSTGGSGSTSPSSSSSRAGAAPTLIAGLGSVMGIVGGMIAAL